MSRIEQTACDGCGSLAPTAHIHGYPYTSAWISVNGPGICEEYDVCSWSCLAAVAVRIAEEVDA